MPFDPSALGLSLPVIQAPMAGVTTPELAAAVSNAGALGSLGLGGGDVEAARRQLRATRALTDGPVNANFFCHQPPRRDVARDTAWIARLAPLLARFGAAAPEQMASPYIPFQDQPGMVEMLLEERPAVVSFHFGLPPADQVAALKSAGITLIASATSVPEARIMAEGGMDGIVAQGWEAGGHRGILDPDGPDPRKPCLTLVAEIAQALPLPVIAAGGLMDAADIRAALDAGATAAQLGTAFLLCPESASDAAYRAALAQARPGSTRMQRAISGRPARSLETAFTRFTAGVDPADVPSYPLAYDIFKQLTAAAKSHDATGYAAQWAGSNAHRATARPAAQLIAEWSAALEQVEAGQGA
ncbi:NAD(P)H-dependent flavin oxidoreductase [Pseudooceanicola nanhaiensis]|uniref:NAD(P)H-dependent flavin oxidoreductase n=1 Tax=Pseudooceanicola nanhaiensis TaxID=375761 RepID=UPI001CD79E10|nr:nitronate monooxygenase [Pseudooceanicola nanhaiensis]MCA0920702.1 nitronate monooxygenase [Pseudooceanicola nanhaiensis]